MMVGACYVLVGGLWGWLCDSGGLLCDSGRLVGLVV